MNKYLLFVILVLLVILLGVYFLPHKTEAPIQPFITTPAPQTNPEVIVDVPGPNAVITSPVTVTGQAPNTWYFEANLPVMLKDANGNILVQKGFHALTDWTVPGLVGFSDTLTFPTSPTQTGTLEIHNDNESGNPANDKVFSVPVRFW